MREETLRFCICWDFLQPIRYRRSSPGAPSPRGRGGFAAEETDCTTGIHDRPTSPPLGAAPRNDIDFRFCCSNSTQIISRPADQVLPGVNLRIMARKAEDEGLLRKDNADVVAQILVLAGFVGHIHSPAELAL